MDNHPQDSDSDASSIPICTECGSDNPRWIKLLPTVWICHLCSGVHRCLSVQNPVQNGVETVETTPPAEEPNTGMVYSSNDMNYGNEGNDGNEATEVAPPESDDLPPYSDEEDSSSDETTFDSDNGILIPAEALYPNGEHNNLVSLEIVPLFDVLRDEDNYSESGDEDDSDDNDENKVGENEREDIHSEDSDDSDDDDQEEDGEEGDGENNDDDSDASDQEGDHDENGVNPDEESDSDPESSDDDDDVPDLEPPMDERASHNNVSEYVMSLDDIYGSDDSEESEESEVSEESEESEDSEVEVFDGFAEDYFGLIFPECLEVVVEDGARPDMGDEEERLYALYYDEMSSDGEDDFAAFAAKECSCDDGELPEEVFQAELTAIAEYEEVLLLQKINFSG